MIKGIAFNDTNAYVFYHDDEEVLKDLLGSWVELTTQVAERNYNLFVKLLDEAFEIPEETTVDGKVEVLKERFGEDFLHSEVFQTLHRGITETYLDVSEPEPDFVAWAEKEGLEVEEVAYLLKL